MQWTATVADSLTGKNRGCWAGLVAARLGAILEKDGCGVLGRHCQTRSLRRCEKFDV